MASTTSDVLLLEVQGWSSPIGRCSVRLSHSSLTVAPQSEKAAPPLTAARADVVGASASAERALSIFTWPQEGKSGARKRRVLSLEAPPGAPPFAAAALAWLLGRWCRGGSSVGSGAVATLLAAAAGAGADAGAGDAGGAAAAGLPCAGPLAPLLRRAPPSAPPRLPLLVYLNPVAGAGKGRAVFSEVEPLLADAGLACEVVLLTARAQPTAALREMPWAALRGYEGVVAVGGDGSLSEVVEGLMAREDWYAAARALALGVLPSGSGNGLAVSMCAAAGLPYSHWNAAWVVAKGGRARIDVASAFVAEERGHGQRPPAWGGAAAAASPSAAALSFQTCDSGAGGDVEVGFVAAAAGGAAGATAAAVVAVGAGKEGGGTGAGGGVAGAGAGAPAALWGARRWSFLSLEWAIIADIDIESEALRACLGTARFDVWGALRCVFLRKYRGAFSYLPASAPPAAGERRARRWSVDEGGEGGCGGEGAAPATPLARALPRLRHLQPFNAPLAAPWVRLEGTFTLLWATNTSHQSVGVSTHAATHHNDGAWTVVLVRDAGRCEMTGVLLGMDAGGGMSALPGVERLACAAWRLEPEPLAEGQPGHVALDGESVAYGPVQAEVHPGLLTVYAPE
jgi:sphingosine kinase